MQSEFTAWIEQQGEWFIGSCPEIPEANGQGRTLEDCRQNLADAVALVLLDRREDALRLASANAVFVPSEEGVSVSIPGFPGCVSEGQTEQDALENIKEPLQDYLAVAKDLKRASDNHSVVVRHTRAA